MARHRRIVVWIGWFVALNVIWLALISAFNRQETVLGLAASAVAATAAVAVLETGLVSFRPRLWWLFGVWRLPGTAIRETWLVFGALGRRVFRGEPIEGRFRTEPFRVDARDGRAAARRTVYTVGLSVAPNTYVVGIDDEKQLVLLHELVPSRRKPPQ